MRNLSRGLVDGVGAFFDAIETQRALRKALRTHNKRWRRDTPDGEIADLLIEADAKAFAQVEFDAFLQYITVKK